MLVLSRKRGEAIAIESDIQIEVLEIRKGRVRLGIQAPKTRRIIRAEVAEREGPAGPPSPQDELNDLPAGVRDPGGALVSTSASR